MTKLALWEYLRENSADWHTAQELRERFNIKQQATLRDWTNVPFIGNYGNNRGKVYKFLDSKIDEFKKVVSEEIEVPQKVLKVKDKEIPVPTEFTDEKYVLRFPFNKGDLMKVAKANMRGVARLGPKYDWAKQAILSVEDNRLSPENKAVVEALIVSLITIVTYNGFDYSEEMEMLKESMTPETIEDIRNAEVADIMKHRVEKRPSIDYGKFPEEWVNE